MAVEVAAGDGGNVLLFEEEPGALASLSRALASCAGVHPLVAADGRRALQLLRRFPVDVLVCTRKAPGPAPAEVVLLAAAGGPPPLDRVLEALADSGRRRRAARLEAWSAGGATGRPTEAGQLLAALEQGDARAAAHAARVADATRLFSRELGLEATDLYVAALLHDVGRRAPEQPAADGGDGEQDELLQFVDRQADPAHPLEGERLVLRLPGGARIASWIRHHHERFDGTGYPDGLRGSRIPLGARALRVADASDQMTAGGMKEALCLQSLLQRAGTELDPRVVRLFVWRTLELAAAGKPPA